jgi:hypothetical protein
MSNASLVGSFNFVALSEQTDVDASSGASVTTGGLTFDGAGNITLVTATDVSSELRTCTGGGGNCFGTEINSSTGSDTTTGTYTVDAVGNVAITIASGPLDFTGTLSSDGMILVLHGIVDGPSGSERTLVLATKQ